LDYTSEFSYIDSLEKLQLLKSMLGSEEGGLDLGVYNDISTALSDSAEDAQIIRDNLGDAAISELESHLGETIMKDGTKVGIVDPSQINSLEEYAMMAQALTAATTEYFGSAETAAEYTK
jgi:hypothetical protein